MAGSSVKTGTAGDVWNTGFGFTSNQINFFDSVSNVLRITGLQMEVGSVATSFEYRPYSTELKLCQRYYFKTNGVVYACGYGTSPSTNALGEINLPSIMRTTPTVTISDTALGSSFSPGSNNTETVYFTVTATSSAAPRANIQASAEI